MITRRVAVCTSLIASGSTFLGSAVPGSRLRGQERSDDAVPLAGAGSTFSAPLYKTWINIFGRLDPKIAVSYDAVGSGEGITRSGSSHGLFRLLNPSGEQEGERG